MSSSCTLCLAASCGMCKTALCSPSFSLPSTKAVCCVQSTSVMLCAWCVRCVTATLKPASLKPCRHAGALKPACGAAERGTYCQGTAPVCACLKACGHVRPEPHVLPLLCACSTHLSARQDQEPARVSQCAALPALWRPLLLRIFLLPSIQWTAPKPSASAERLMAARLPWLLRPSSTGSTANVRPAAT